MNKLQLCLMCFTFISLCPAPSLSNELPLTPKSSEQLDVEYNDMIRWLEDNKVLDDDINYREWLSRYYLDSDTVVLAYDEIPNDYTISKNAMWYVTLIPLDRYFELAPVYFVHCKHSRISPTVDCGLPSSEERLVVSKYLASFTLDGILSPSLISNIEESLHNRDIVVANLPEALPPSSDRVPIDDPNLIPTNSIRFDIQDISHMSIERELIEFIHGSCNDVIKFKVDPKTMELSTVAFSHGACIN